MSVSKLLLSGPPGSGKTTLVERMLSETSVSACGFVTREICQSGRRVGFRIIGLSGSSEVLAHTKIGSIHSVGKYRVDIEALDKTLQSEFSGDSHQLAIIDEIGKMELLSQRFRSTIRKLWESKQAVVATIMSARNAFCDRLKADKNTIVYELNYHNRHELLTKLKAFVESSKLVQTRNKE